MSRQIMVCFVRSDSSVLQESWLNSMASWFAGNNNAGGAPYIHAELLFIPKANALSTKSEVYGTACSIVYNNYVHLEKSVLVEKNGYFVVWNARMNNIIKCIIFVKNIRAMALIIWDILCIGVDFWHLNQHFIRGLV